MGKLKPREGAESRQVIEVIRAENPPPAVTEKSRREQGVGSSGRTQARAPASLLPAPLPVVSLFAPTPIAGSGPL